jgi:hypothetical protein
MTTITQKFTSQHRDFSFALAMCRHQASSFIKNGIDGLLKDGNSFSVKQTFTEKMVSPNSPWSKSANDHLITLTLELLIIPPGSFDEIEISNSEYPITTFALKPRS